MPSCSVWSLTRCSSRARPGPSGADGAAAGAQACFPPARGSAGEEQGHFSYFRHILQPRGRAPPRFPLSDLDNVSDDHFPQHSRASGRALITPGPWGVPGAEFPHLSKLREGTQAPPPPPSRAVCPQICFSLPFISALPPQMLSAKGIRKPWREGGRGTCSAFAPAHGNRFQGSALGGGPLCWSLSALTPMARGGRLGSASGREPC